MIDNVSSAAPEDLEIEVQNMRLGAVILVQHGLVRADIAKGPGDGKDDMEWLDDNLRVFFDQD